MAMTSKFTDILEKEFPGYKKFQGIQENVISNVTNNNSTLVIAPTGSGKSLMYWVSARALKGVCIIVSPLISLIDEQSSKLRNFGFNVLALHSSKSASEKKRDLDQIKEFALGKISLDFIFLSPERISMDGFIEYCIRKQRDKIKLFVIDEVHCISQWGFDFRPFYKRIPNFLDLVFGNEWPTILAMTATINPKELEEVCQDLKITRNNILKDKHQLRNDIDICVKKFKDEKIKREYLFNLLNNNKDKKTLVYLYRKYDKNGVEELCEECRNKGFNVAYFHGDMTSQERQNVLNDFHKGKTNLIFATNAFGMGIDIPNIRLVIHYMIPESIEQYYQEIGRAGRDQKGAQAILLYSDKNFQIRKTHYIDKSFLNEKQIQKCYSDNIGKEGLKSIIFDENNDFYSIFNYLLKMNILDFLSKGVDNIENYILSDKSKLKEIFSKTKSGLTIQILKKTGISSTDLMKQIYQEILEGKITNKKSIPKCLFVNSNQEELDSNSINTISKELQKRKCYKYDLLDSLKGLLESYDNSLNFHKKIGEYLNVSNFEMGKIHITEKGDFVRSKSEVIIANILYRSELYYKYEEPLYYNDNQCIVPDFTIHINNKKYYLEHLGLLDKKDYKNHWIEKKSIYERMGLSDYLITTEESPNLSKIIDDIVDRIKK